MRLPLRALDSTNGRDKKKKSRQRRATRKTHVETLEVRQLMTIAPSIAAVAVDHTSLYQGDPLTLTASGVQDSDGSVTGVSVYRDTNGNQTLDANDQSLGQGTNQGSGNWTFQVDTSALLGVQTFFATATDNDQMVSNPMAASTLVLNHAPTIAGSGLSFAQARDLSSASNLGAKVADLTGGISDPDPAAVRGVAIVAINQAHGVLQYSTNNGSSWTDVGTVSTTSALLLSADASTRIRLVPSGGYLGSVADAVTFRAWDQSTGAAGTKVDVSVNGGTTSFSAATVQAGFTITPIIGQPVTISSGSFAQEQHAVASDAAGNFVAVTGDRSTGVFSMQRFTAAGVPLGSAQALTSAGSGASGPVIAMAADGHFVTTWQTPSANGLTLWARRFNADLTPAAAAFQVDVDAWSYDFAASISMAGDGKFVLTWLRYVPGNGIPLWIYGQRYDADGVAQGGTFVQNSPAWMFKPAVAMADDGSFVLSWYGYGWDWAPQGIFLQRYSANGDRSGGLAQVTADSVSPQISMNAAGQFVVMWAAPYNGHTAVWARSYNAQAQAVTDAFLVDASPAAANPVGIAVAMDGTGDFLVTWSATEGGHQGIFAHWYSAGGVSRASQFTIATADPSLTLTNVAGGLSQPRLTATATGSLLVAWSTILNNGTSSGVTAQRLQWNEAPVASATISTLYLAQGSGVVSFDAATYFSDADLIYGDALTYTAVSSNANLIAVTGASGSQLSLNVAAQLGLASLTVQVTDRAGRTASAAIPVSVFNPANDAPVLVSRSPVKEQARDLTSASNLGLRIADMILGVSDLDPGALRGVALTGASTSHGSYQYRLSDDAAWTDIGAVSGTSSLLLPASAAARIRFVPVGGFVGTVSGGLTLRAWDQTTGTAETKVNTLSTGGTSAFSSATDQVTFNVTPAVGDQLQIRTSSYQQTGQAVASDRQGNFVAVWAGVGLSDSGLFYQRFSASGSSISTAQQVANAGVSVASAAIGMAPDGSFVLAWQSTDQNGQLVAKSQRFTAAGVAFGSAFQLDSGGSFNYRLSVAVGGDGAFAIAWQTFTSWSAPLGIHVQRFAPDGSKIGNPFKVDADNWSFAPSISMAQDDSFVVAWYAYNWHGPGAGAFYPEGIKARRYDSQGVAIGPQFNVSALGTAESPSVSMNASGGFTVVWSTADPSNHSVASVRSYDNQGQPLSDPIVVDNTSTRQHRSEITVATGDSGEYLMTWTADLGTTIGIRAQAFLANGSPLADPFWLQSRDALSLTGSAGLRAPLVVPTGHGSFLALSSEFDSAGSSTGIVGRQLQLESAPVVAPSIPPLYASQNAASSSIDVSGYFSDADTVFGDSLSYSLVSGNDSLAQLSLLGSALTLTYTGQTGARQVVVRATDSSNRSIDAVLPVSIYNPANDAPVLAQRPHALFMPRDLTDANNQGLLVTDLLAGVSDLDPGALRGIAITAVNTANGTYQYRVSDNSTWTDVGTVSGTSSLLLKADGSTRIRFVAAAGFVGSVADAITFRAWDQTSGASGTKVDTSTNGGTAAFSTSTDQLAFSITPLAGSQITVDAGGYLQEGHAVATDKQGNFVTVWSGNGTADGGLFFQRYSASGTALGAQQRVVSAGTSVFSPAIGMSPDGDFVVAWQGLNQAGQPIVLARQYSASGVAKGGAVQIAGAGNYYYSLAAGMSPDGSFVLSWQTFTPSWQPLGIQVQRFAADGSPVGNSFRADGDNWAWAPSVGMAGDGSFAVAWQAANWHGPGIGAFYPEGIMARRFDSQGIAQGAQIHVSGIGTASLPSLSMNATGAFVISWSTNDGTNHPVLSARSYNAAGDPLSDPVVVDNAPSIWPITHSSVAIDDLGEYLVTWAAGEANHEGIRAHWYSPNGQPLADQFWVASADATASIGQGLLDNAQIAASPGGSFVIVWDKRNSDDGSSTGVFAQRLQLNHAPVAAKLPVTYIAKNSGPSTINVATSTYFTDADAQFGDHLLYSMVSSDSAVVTASVTPDGQLTLFAVAGVTGATQVVVRAQDGAGRFANLALRLSIYDPAGDAPTLVHSPLAQVQARDVSDSANLGIKVADLVGGVADLDPGALRGIAIVAANSTRGDYQYRLSDTGPWVTLGSVTTTDALLLSAEGTARIRLVSPTWSLGSTADGLTFRAWDQTGGAAGTKVDTTINGGASAFSTATDQVSFTITPVVGQPLAISSGSFAQEQHAIASDAAGNFVAITGDRSTGAFNMQRFTAAGVPIGSAQSLTAAGSGAFSPVIAMTADGHFVATWQVPGTSGLALWARRFNADLTPVAAAFQVTSDPVGYDLGTAVSMASDGKFVITWLKYWPNGVPLLMYGQRYDANGLAQGGIFVQNSPAWMFSPAVAMAGDGSFVLAWRGINWDGPPQGTFLQRYNALGQPVGGTSLVTTDGTASTQVSINAAGQFVVTWTTAYNGHTSVWARTYNAQAQPLTAAILVDAAADTAHPVGAVAAIDALGDFLVTWTATENGTQGLFAHWYSSSGGSLADQFTIATADPALTLHNLRGGLADPHLTATPAGSLIATWATMQRDGSSSGVSAQRLNIHRNPPTLTAPIAAVAVNQDRQNVVIDLGLHFADADTSTGDVLTYSALSGNISLVAASISGSLLTLSFPGSTPGSATITVIATDRNGNSLSTTFNASLNTAPALVHTALGGFVERDPAQPNPGVLVSSLTAGMSDADTGAGQGVAIVDVNQVHGSLQYSSNNGVTWTNVGPVSASHALLLPANANTRVRLLPTDAYLGTVSNAITLRAWDQTSGTPGAYSDTTASGGITPFSAATDTVSMTIDPLVGGRIQANSDSTGYHNTIGTALDAQGNAVVAWTIYNGGTSNLIANRYQRGGTPMGSQFQVNPAGTSVNNAAMAMSASGTSIFVWSVYSGGATTVYSQRFNNATGAAVDAAPVTLFSGADSPGNLSVGIATSGGFVVSYAKSGYANNAWTTTIYARVYDASNVLQGGNPITVASGGSVWSPTLSVGSDGSFVVEWTSYAGGNYQLQALRYTAGGALRDLGTPVQVLAPSSNWINGATVAQQADGSFVALWQQYVTSGYQVWARRFDSTASGAAAVRVDTQLSGSSAPAIAVDSRGDFGVLWTAAYPANGVLGRFFNAASQPASDPFPINPSDTGIPGGGLALAANAQGDFAATWASYATNYSSEQIQTQRLQLNQSPTIAASSPAVNMQAYGDPTFINLANYFADADLPYRDQLTYTITANDNPSLLTTSITGNRLMLVAASTTGLAHLTISASDASGQTVSMPLQVTVILPIPQLPSIASFDLSESHIAQGSDLTFWVDATDQDGAVSSVSFYHDSNSSGVYEPGVDRLLGTDHDASDGWGLTFSTEGLPIGDQTFFAVSTDNDGQTSAAQAASAHVFGHPILDPIVAQQANQGQQLTFTATAHDLSDPNAILTYSINDNAPAGMAMNPDTGEFSWTPTAEQAALGSAQVTVLATADGDYTRIGSRIVNISVNAPPRFNALPAPADANEDIFVGFDRNSDATRSLDFIVTAQDNTQVSYSAQGMPPGAMISSGGAFHWRISKPLDPVTYNVSVQATDAHGLSSTKTFRVSLGFEDAPPSVLPVVGIVAGGNVTTLGSANPHNGAFSLRSSVDPFVQVHYAFAGGSAQYGVDYYATDFAPGWPFPLDPLPSSGDFAVGQHFDPGQMPIHALQHHGTGGVKTIVLQLLPDSSYTIADGQARATIVLRDDEVVPALSILPVRDAITGGQTGAFLLHRSDSQGMTVAQITSTGAARQGIEFNFTGGVFYDGQSDALIVVTAAAGSGVGEDEAITLSVANEGTAAPVSASILLKHAPSAGRSDWAPVSHDDHYVASADGTTLTIDAEHGLLTNDLDHDGLAVHLTAKIVSQPQHGTVTVNPDGSFTYTPNNGFVSVETFTYEASDGRLDGNLCSVSIITPGAPVAAPDTLVLFVNLDQEVPTPEADTNLGLTRAEWESFNAKRDDWVAAMGTPSVPSNTKSRNLMIQYIENSEHRLAAVQALVAQLDAYAQTPGHSHLAYVALLEHAVREYDQYLFSLQRMELFKAKYLTQYILGAGSQELLARAEALPLRVAGIDATVTQRQWNALNSAYDAVGESINAKLTSLNYTEGAVVGGLKGLAVGGAFIALAAFPPTSVFALGAGAAFLAAGVGTGLGAVSSGRSSLSDVTWAGVATATGYRDIQIGLTGTDPVTGNRVRLSAYDQGQKFGQGLSALFLTIATLGSKPNSTQQPLTLEIPDPTTWARGGSMSGFVIQPGGTLAATAAKASYIPLVIPAANVHVLTTTVTLVGGGQLVVYMTAHAGIGGGNHGDNDEAGLPEIRHSNTAHDVGVQLGKEFAHKRGLQETDFVNPFDDHGSFGQGFDGVLEDANHNFWIAEYKGGNSDIGPPQMTLAWVRGNIERIREYKGDYMLGTETGRCLNAGKA